MDRQLQPIEYSNQRILTTQQIADFYGTEPQRITNNYNRNKSYYVVGQHYYFLEGDELKTFLSATQIELQTHLRNLYLWTKEGAFLHAKSLNTDRAWEVFLQLNDNYFRPQFAFPLQGYSLERLLTQDRLEFNEKMRRIRRVYRAIHPSEPKSLPLPKESKILPTIQDKIMEVFSKQPRGTFLKSYDICRLGGTQLRHAGTDAIRKDADELVTMGLLTKEGSGKSALYGLI